MTTVECDLQPIKTKAYGEFHFYMSNHVGEKCGKLCIFFILSSKRVNAVLLQKLTQIDDARLDIKFIKQVLYNISAQYAKTCRKKKPRKTVYFKYSMYLRETKLLQKLMKIHDT